MRSIRSINLALALIMCLCIYLNYQYYVVPSMFLNSLVASASSTRNQGDPEGVARLYSFEVSLPKASPGELHTYTMRFMPIEEASAMRLFRDFGFAEHEVLQGDALLVGYNDSASMTIYRYTRGLRYISAPTARSVAARSQRRLISPEESEEIAMAFVARHGLYAPYHEVEAQPIPGGFAINFINRIGGLKIYQSDYDDTPISTSLHLDAHGSPTQFVHAGASFERLSTHPAMSAHHASALLPTDHGHKVTITSVELLYTLANSILQPAYLFKGTHQDGTEFRHLVPASQF